MFLILCQQTQDFQLQMQEAFGRRLCSSKISLK